MPWFVLQTTLASPFAEVGVFPTVEVERRSALRLSTSTVGNQGGYFLPPKSDLPNPQLL
jgi:hypothetical protein